MIGGPTTCPAATYSCCGTTDSSALGRATSSTGNVIPTNGPCWWSSWTNPSKAHPCCGNGSPSRNCDRFTPIQTRVRTNGSEKFYAFPARQAPDRRPGERWCVAARDLTLQIHIVQYRGHHGTFPAKQSVRHVEPETSLNPHSQRLQLIMGSQF